MKDEEIIVGGQAVIEGVMMRAPHSYAVAVRKPDGEIVVRAEKLPVLAEKYPILKLPILRGAAVLIHSMMLGIKSLNFSANVVFHDALTEPDSSDSTKVEIATVGSATLTTGTMTVAAHAAPLPNASAAPTKAKQGKSKAAKAKSTSSAAAIGSIIFALFFNV